jgi:hypothetical protein
MFFSGAQLISLGIIGEYLGRVYDEVKARPLFLVADELGLEGRDPRAEGQSSRPRQAGDPGAPARNDPA